MGFPQRHFEPIPTLVDEETLVDFRARFLSPAALLQHVEANVRVLVRLGIGVGKSSAIDALLESEETYRHFDLVVYAAPTWNILNERKILRAPDPVRLHRVIRPRPAARCGPYRTMWAALEKQKCFSLAKRTLCRPCQSRKRRKPKCPWPQQFKELDGTKVILLTEKQFMLNRGLLPTLLQKTGAKRPLIILDEAQFFDASFEMVVPIEALRTFTTGLEAFRNESVHPEVVNAWIDELRAVERSTASDLRSSVLRLPRRLINEAPKIQELGVHQHGESYRFLAYDLLSLRDSESNSRSKDTDGSIRFVCRPLLKHHLIVFSAHLAQEFVGHRLGCGIVPSPFEHTLVRHRQTRIFNLANRIGSARSFVRHGTPALDLFAVAIARNVAKGITTVLVARKRLKEFCADYLSRRLAGWGVRVRFLHGDGMKLPVTPSPKIIPVLHYGVRGVNDYSSYDAAYCVTSYYVPTSVIADQVYEAAPGAQRVALEIDGHPERCRRVVARTNDPSDAGVEELANMYLRKLEIDPVIQAVGRVRFLTKPREIVTFQQHDLRRDVGEVLVSNTPTDLYSKMGLPTAREVDRAVEATRAQDMLSAGLTPIEIASKLGISRSSVYERLRARVRPDSPLKDICKGVSGRLKAPSSTPGGSP